MSLPELPPLLKRTPAQLREGIVKKKPAVTLSDEVECDEAYVIAGHKGQPEVVKSKERQGRRRRLQGKAGRGTLAKERPPVFGMMQRGGKSCSICWPMCSKRPSNPSSKTPSFQGHVCIRTSIVEFISIMIYCASHKRRHHVWPVSGSPMGRPAPRSSSI